MMLSRLGLGLTANRGGGGAAPSAVGALALLSGETDGWAANFTYSDNSKRVAKKAAGVSTEYAPDDFITQSGTSAKWVFNSSGVLSQVAVNDVAIDHNPLTPFAPKGLLVEVGVTNLELRSNEIDNAAWTKINSSITANQAVAPNGLTEADQITANGVSGVHYVHPAATRTWTNVPHTLSAVGKKGTQNFVWLGAFDGTNSFGGVFNLNTGVYVGDRTGAASTVAAIRDWADGDYLCSITFTPVAAATGFSSQYGTNASGALGLSDSSTGYVYLSNLQVEVGRTPTTRIPTAGSAVARVADQPNFANSSIPFDATTGTVYLKATTPAASGTTYVLWSDDDGTANERFRIERNSSNEIRCIVTDGGVEQANLNLGTVANSTEFRVAFAWATGDFAASLDGAVPVTDAAGTLPTVTTFRLGYSTAGEQWNSHIAECYLLPRRVTNGGLQSATAPFDGYTIPTVAMKSSATTGSINSGTNTLTVANAGGLAVGDPIIVEIGAEPGAGMRGTVGVGGTWPAQSYTQAQMDAATVPASGVGSYAYVTDGVNAGNVYSWNGTAWVENGYTPKYYVRKFLPRSLETTITNKVGNVLTLADNASATATNANVYFDNYDVLNDLPIGAAVNVMPAGTFRFRGNVYRKDYDTSHNGWQLRGQGRNQTILQIPKGCDGSGLYFNGTWNGGFAGAVIADFRLVGNFANDGFGLQFSSENAPLGINTLGEVGDLAYGLNIRSCDGVDIQRVRVDNFMSHHFRCQYSSNLHYQDCEVYRIGVYDQYYLQWLFQIVDSGDTGENIVDDLYVNCDYITKAVNTFDSSGSVFNRLYMRNGLFANNSSTGVVFTDLEVVIEPDKYVFDVQTPIHVNELRVLDMNSNIAQVGGSPQHLDPGSGALIGIKSIEIQGFVAANRPFGLINMSGGGDVWLYGDYDPTEADDGNRKGLISGPWYSASAAAKGPIIDTISPRTKVSGLRITSHAVDGSEAQGSQNAIVSYGTFTTTTSNINALGTGTGTIAVANAAKFDGIGFLTVGSERMAYEKVSDTSLTITGRAQGGTSAATHANGATVAYLDTPIFIDNIIENISVTNSGVALKTVSGNVTNAAYDAL